MASQLIKTSLKGHSCTHGWLRKNHGHGHPLEWLIASISWFQLGLHYRRPIQDLEQRFLVKIVQVKEVCRPFLFLTWNQPCTQNLDEWLHNDSAPKCSSGNFTSENAICNQQQSVVVTLTILFTSFQSISPCNNTWKGHSQRLEKEWTCLLEL